MTQSDNISACEFLYNQDLDFYWDMYEHVIASIGYEVMEELYDKYNTPTPSIEIQAMWIIFDGLRSRVNRFISWLYMYIK